MRAYTIVIFILAIHAGLAMINVGHIADIYGFNTTLDTSTKGAIVFVNNGEYCGKILCFDKGKKFSMHYHIEKKETWYVSKGKFLMHWINPADGTLYSEYLNVGDVITNERGEPHQVMALEESELFEVSTHHCDEDSFRIWRGD